MNSVKVHSKKFRLSIPFSRIKKAVKNIADKLNREYSVEDHPVFISVLNGSFMFAADLFKELNFQPSLSFIKVASYIGEYSSGEVKELVGLSENIKGKHVIILEDIVDTGFTIEFVYNQLLKQKPKSVKIITLLFKKEAYQGNLNIDYVGIVIPDKFIVGYGLDYEGLGRNYKDIYELMK